MNKDRKSNAGGTDIRTQMKTHRVKILISGKNADSFDVRPTKAETNPSTNANKSKSTQKMSGAGLSKWYTWAFSYDVHDDIPTSGSLNSTTKQGPC